MPDLDHPYFPLIVALGIGLLIGAERERRKGEGPFRSAAGIRTFAITAVLGAVSVNIGGEILLSVTMAGVIGLTAIAYFRSRSDDPGLTTEIALILTLALGGLAMREPARAAALAVTVAILLAARGPMHRFVREVLTEAELKSALIFAAATLVVWPVIPDRYLGPFEAINPRSIWTIVILIMAISACGYVAVRALGARYGLPAAGLASGFVSSSATIAAMGARVVEDSRLLGPAVAGAVLSTIATVAQVAIVVAATSPITLMALGLPLIFAGLAAVAYGLIFGLRLTDTTPISLAKPGEGIQFQGSALVGSNPGHRASWRRSAAHLARRPRIARRRRRGRFRRRPRDGRFDRRPGRGREIGSPRRMRTDLGRVHDQFSDEDHSCNCQRQQSVRTSGGAGPRRCLGGSVDGSSGKVRLIVQTAALARRLSAFSWAASESFARHLGV